MNTILIKLESLYRSFSRSEKKIADYISKNLDKIPFQSIYEISKVTKLSVASLSRFARKIGYDDFKNFKIDLVKYNSVSIHDMYESVSESDSDRDIINKAFIGNTESIKNTLKIIDHSHLIEASKLISNSKRIVFFGMGGSGTVAQDASMRFSQLDIQAEAYTEAYQMIIQAFRIKKGEIAFGISHSGRSQITVRAIEIAKQNKAITMGVANYLKSPLNNASDYFFCTSFPETRVKIAALSSLVAQICIIDAIYLLIARYKKELWDIRKLDASVEELFKITNGHKFRTE